MIIKTTKSVYLKKGNVGYEFHRGYKYGEIDGDYQAISNTFFVTKSVLYGFTWSEDTTKFDTADEGNKFFKELTNSGYHVCSKSEYDELRPWD